MAADQDDTLASPVEVLSEKEVNKKKKKKKKEKKKRKSAESDTTGEPQDAETSIDIEEALSEEEPAESSHKRQKLEKERQAQVVENARIVYNVSDELAAIIGESKATRQNALSLVNKYIEDNKLVDSDGNLKDDPKLSKAFQYLSGYSFKYTVVREVKKHLSLPSDGSFGIDGDVGELGTWKDNKSSNKQYRTGVFSSQEDDILRRKVHQIAQQNNYSTTNYDWLMKTTRNGGYKWKEGLWAQIATALPERRYKAVYDRGIRLFRPQGAKGKWSKDEDDALKDLYSKHKNGWKLISQVLGRTPESCRDHYRKIISNTRKYTKWTEEECDALKGIVEEFLEKRTDSGNRVRRQRDDITWVKIAKDMNEKKGFPFTAHQCMQKYYKELCPSMVTKGDWGQGNDRTLMANLYTMGRGKQEWQINWGELVPGRTAAQVKRRWQLMQKSIPDYQDKTLEQKTKFLLERYAPDII